MIPGGRIGPLAWRSATRAARRWLLALAVAAAALWLRPAPAWAQAPLVWDRAEVQLWPEYDQPATLVIVDGWLPASTSLPTVLNVRLPAAAADPHAVAVRTPAGELLDANYTILPAEDDIIVAFTTEQLSFRVEYYDPALIVTGANRALDFAWTSGYAVNAVSVRVQEPAGASGLRGDPALTALGTGGDGLNYYQRDFGAVAAGGEVALSVSYSKASSTLSVEALGAGVADTSNSPTAAPSGNSNLPIILGGTAVGLGLLGLGAVMYLRGRRPPARRAVQAKRTASRIAPARRRHASEARPRPAVARAPGPQSISSAPVASRTPPSRQRGGEPGAAPAPDGQAFCTRCGHRLQAEDRFCRQCGLPVAQR